MKAIPPESLSSTVEKVNENCGHVKRKKVNMRIMKASWQVVLLWQVPLEGLILLDDFYLLSPYLKSDFEISEMRNLKKNQKETKPKNRKKPPKDWWAEQSALSHHCTNTWSWHKPEHCLKRASLLFSDLHFLPWFFSSILNQVHHPGA